MRIYSKVVIDIASGDTVSSESFDYVGPVAECKGGGGGSSSGAVDYPAYMKTQHETWLGEMATLITDGQLGNPYSGVIAYSPANDIATINTALNTLSTDVSGITDSPLWDSYITQAKTTLEATVFDDATIAAASSAHNAVLDDVFLTDTLPRFQTGMRDINAVMSSTFVIGQAIIEGFKARDLALFDSKLRLHAQEVKYNMISSAVTEQFNLLQLKISYRKSSTEIIVDSTRINAVLNKEALSDQLDIDFNEYNWGLTLYQNGANMLGAISGSAVSTKNGHRSGSTLGGALSGAASGAMIGSAIPGGTLIGAAIGGIAGALL